MVCRDASVFCMDNKRKTARTLAVCILAAHCGPPSPVIVPLIDEYVERGNRFCVYDDLGSDYIITLRLPEACPRYLEL